MGPIGVQEMVIIFLVALVLFGPKKLPELGKTLAKAMSEFRRAQNDLKATFDREMQNIERETASVRDATQRAAAEITSYSEVDLNLHGGSNSTYDHTSSTHSVESGQPGFSESLSTVSASASSGAELHADSTPHTAYHDDNAAVSLGVQGTVPRGAAVAETPAVPVAEKVAAAELNPLPEFEQPGGASTKNSGSELPSIV
jgi:sec-independent protein translocase protein TatA